MFYVKSVRQVWIVGIRKLWPSIMLVVWCILIWKIFSTQWISSAWKTKTVFSDKKKIHMYWFEIDKHDYSTIISKVQGAKQIVGDAKKFELEWADCMKKNKWNKYNLIVPKNTNICISVDTIILLLGFYYRRSNLVCWNCLIWFYAITIIWFDNYRLI